MTNIHTCQLFAGSKVCAYLFQLGRVLCIHGLIAFIRQLAKDMILINPIEKRHQFILAALGCT